MKYLILLLASSLTIACTSSKPATNNGAALAIAYNVAVKDS